MEIYKYLRVFIYGIPRKRIPGKYYLEIENCPCLVDAGRDKQELMEKMERDKKALYEDGLKLVLDDLECS